MMLYTYLTTCGLHLSLISESHHSDQMSCTGPSGGMAWIFLWCWAMYCSTCTQSDCEECLVTILLHLQLEVVHEGPVFLVDNAVGDEEADKAHTDQAQTHKQKPLSLTRLREI